MLATTCFGGQKGNYMMSDFHVVIVALDPFFFFFIPNVWVQVANASSQAQQSNPVWHVDGSVLHAWVGLYDWTNSQVSL